MPQKFRILYTISEFMYGSKIRNLCDLVSGLDRNLFDIEIGALEIGNEATPEIESLDVPFYVLRTLPPRRPDMKRIRSLLASPFSLKRKRFDVVHSLLYQSLFTEPLMVKTFSSAKYVYTKSNLEWDNHRLNWRLKSTLADRVVSISHATDELLTREGFGNKTARIYLGVDTDRFTSSTEKRLAVRSQYQVPDTAIVFGCAAAFVEIKEHLTLISAFEQLSRDTDEVWLFLCGPNHNDAYYEKVLSTIERSAARQRIVLMGTLQDMVGFYSAIDCFVLPSRYEAFGYVLVEAMSCRRAVIACRTSGPLEITVDGETGFLSPVSDHVDLAEKMNVYVKNRLLLDVHGRAARTRVCDMFSKEAMVRKCQELYFSLAEPSRR